MIKDQVTFSFVFCVFISPALVPRLSFVDVWYSMCSHLKFFDKFSVLLILSIGLAIAIQTLSVQCVFFDRFFDCVLFCIFPLISAHSSYNFRGIPKFVVGFAFRIIAFGCMRNWFKSTHTHTQNTFSIPSTFDLCNINSFFHAFILRLEYSESDSESSSSEQKNRGALDGYYKMNRKAQSHKRRVKKRTAIPVQPPKVPPFGTFVSPPEIPIMYQKMKADATKKLSTLEKGASRPLNASQLACTDDFMLVFLCFQGKCMEMSKKKSQVWTFHRRVTITHQL